MKKKKMTKAEAGRLGGIKKNPNKGFGANPEKAKEAAMKAWANKRASMAKELKVTTHHELLASDPK